MESRWPMVSGTWTLGGAQHSTYCYEDEDRGGGHSTYGDEEWDDYDDVDIVMIMVMIIRAPGLWVGPRKSTYYWLKDRGYH